MIGMLVSVLVDRYQRVYARKLYIQEEIIDFDDETNSIQLPQIDLEDPDQRTRINSAFDSDTHDQSTTEIIIEENPIHRQNSRVHFIIGYVDDQSQQTSSDLLETISSMIVDKQSIDENIQLSIISPDDGRLSTSHDVQFDVSSISDEELTEIGSGQGKKGSVLKSFISDKSKTFC